MSPTHVVTSPEAQWAQSPTNYSAAASPRERERSMPPNNAAVSTPHGQDCSPTSVSVSIGDSTSVHSIMQDVRAEIGTLQERNVAGLRAPPQQNQCSLVEEKSSSMWSFFNTNSIVHHLSRKLGHKGEKTPSRSRGAKTPCSLYSYDSTDSPQQTNYWSIPFRFVVICPTLAMIFVSAVAFVTLAVFSHHSQHETLAKWRSSNRDTLGKWRLAVTNAQNFAVQEVLGQVDRKIFMNFVEPPDRAVDTLAGASRFIYNRDKANMVNANFPTATQLRQVEIRAWEALSNQWNCQFAGSQTCPGRSDSLFTTFNFGGFAGSAFAKLNGTVQQRVINKEPGRSLQIWHADTAIGSRVAPSTSRPMYDPSAQPFNQTDNRSIVFKTWSPIYLLWPWVELDSGVTLSSPNIYRKVSNVGGWGGRCTCPNGEVYEVGDNMDACASLACDGGISGTCSPFGINSANAGYKAICGARVATRANSTSQMVISRTSPIVFNGTWSGFVVADISLERISLILNERWYELKRNLDRDWGYTISPANSNIFVVNQVSPRFPAQEGLLLGSSHDGWFRRTGFRLQNASDSTIPIISDACQSILLRHGTWNSQALLRTIDTVFYFSVSGLRSGVLQTCDPLGPRSGDMSDCVQVATHSMSLDDEVRWLVVVVLPSEAYFRTYNEQVAQTTSGIDNAQQNTNRTLDTTNAVCIVIIVFATVISLLMAFGTNVLVLRPLSRLGVLMYKLGNLEFSHNSTEYQLLHSGARGRVREVNVLREVFCRLSQSIETFAKFVPETVVRELVSGDEQKRHRATQLHVTRKNVTIMFSDVKDFTTISESLPQKQLLFVLTLYLTVMTRIIESFEGVVGEVLGDGLLCFWNTPNPVEEHAAKACMAALAQQQALGPLNMELKRRNLPELQIRIGLHTGDVLTGNIGSEQKMKFGCMGDPVNLASRLEGLCKVYGVGIMCSSATCDALPQDHGFVTRRLDLVQVKGKKEPTLIHEVIGVDAPNDEWNLEPVSPARVAQKQIYEQALDAYQKAEFSEAVQYAENIHKQCPDDLAAINLLERAKNYETKAKGGFWDFLNGGAGSPKGDVRSHWTGVEKMTDK